MRLTRMLAACAALLGMGASLPPGAERAARRREQEPVARKLSRGHDRWDGGGFSTSGPNDPFWAKACREENAKRKARAWDARHRSERAQQGRQLEAALKCMWQERRDARAAMAA